MNNYHLYEEIGHGKFTTVYKGRKRYTIRYVAVKSIEKTRREKVMMEISVLSQLAHPNIVGFINWYETRNHLWVVSEYCAGGDLMRLLKQDRRLPEDQVRRFGRNICAGLLHVQARSVVYSDLKPANILFNEEGVLKLADFGHSQRLEDIEHALQERIPLPRRGTPHYWAPELFYEGGMHSFASDLWAFGCVLYELLVGRPPFHCSSFAQLQQVVLQESAPATSGSTPELQALLVGLLRKGPLDRLGWPAVRSHGFWQGRPPGDEGDAAALPTQPHLEELRNLWSSLCGGAQQGALPHPSVPQLGGHGGSAASSGGATSPVANLDASGQRASSPNTDNESDERELRSQVEPDAELEPPRNGGGGGGPTGAAAEAAAAAAEAAAAAQQAAQQAAAIGTATPSQLGAPASSLRSRLGAVTYARVRELVALAETGVRPISRNPQIEEPESLETPPDLPFTPMRLAEVCSRPHAELETFLTKVYTCIAQGSSDQKVGALKYLEQICCHMQVADLVVNSSLLRLILRMLYARKAPSAGGAGAAGNQAAASAPLRIRLLSLVGQLLRHATYLEPTVADMGLFDVLLQGFTEQDAFLRRRAAAALGELLFYIATQPPPNGANPPSPTKVATENASAANEVGGWQVPTALLQVLVHTLLSTHEDEVMQHYAAKTVENIATQSPAIAQQWFFSPELLRALAGHVRRSTCDPFRLSCLATVGHLLRGRPEVVEPVPFADPGLISIGLSDLAPQGVPHSMQLLASLLLRAPGVEALAGALPEDVAGLLAGVASQPRYSGGLRGRAALLLTLLFALEDVHEARHLWAAIDSSFVPYVDRLGREKDRFVVQCVAATATVMDIIALSILQSLVEGLRQLSATAAEDPSAESLAATSVRLLPVFFHLVSSVTLCGCVLGSRSLPLLGAICELTARTPLPPASQQLGQTVQALQQLQPLVLSVVEALSAQQALVLEHAPQMVRCILPALAAFLPSSRSDVRLLAMKSFSGVCVMFLNDSHIFDPTVEKPTETTHVLEALLCSRALPVLPLLLGDEAPAPSYALRLLATLLSRGSSAAGAAVRELGLAQQLLAALRGQQGLTLHSALLAYCLLQGRDVEVRDLHDAGVLHAVHAALCEAAEAAAGLPAQMDFAMADAALCVAEEALSQAASAVCGSGATAGAREPRQLLQDLGPLLRALAPLLALCPTLARAKLAPLLERAAACCQHLAEIARCFEQDRRQAVADFGSQGVAALLETLASLARWKPQESGSVRSLQRRILLLLGRAVTCGASAEVRAEVASGVERLLRERQIGDDPAVVADAHSIMSAAVRVA